MCSLYLKNATNNTNANNKNNYNKITIINVKEEECIETMHIHTMIRVGKLFGTFIFCECYKQIKTSVDSNHLEILLIISEKMTSQHSNVCLFPA